MKEAVGGSWILGIVVTFIVLFASFIAVAINYTKAFRVKNEIINIIERNEGLTTSGTPGVAGESAQDQINEYLTETGYNQSEITNLSCPEEIYGDDREGALQEPGNYCVRLIDDGSGSTGYYKVTTFVIIEFPMFGMGITVPVSGETKTLYNIPDGGVIG